MLTVPEWQVQLSGAAQGKARPQAQGAELSHLRAQAEAQRANWKWSEASVSDPALSDILHHIDLPDNVTHCLGTEFRCGTVRDISPSEHRADNAGKCYRTCGRKEAHFCAVGRALFSLKTKLKNPQLCNHHSSKHKFKGKAPVCEALDSLYTLTASPHR